MAVTSEDLKKWASGRLSNTVTDNAPDGVPSDRDPLDDEPGEALRNSLWAGDVDRETVISPEVAAELLEFLESEEPEIADPLFDLADAVAADDADMTSAAGEELLAASQQQTDYPELDPEQRSEMVRLVAEEIRSAGSPERGSPEWAVAIAKGVAAARANEAISDDVGEDFADDGRPAFSGADDVG